MIESLIGLIVMLGMIWGAVIQQNTVLFDIMALIFVVGIAFFYALACGGNKWQRLEKLWRGFYTGRNFRIFHWLGEFSRY